MEWISIKERIPRKNTDVLIFNVFNSGRVEIGCWFNKYTQNKETIIKWGNSKTGFIFGGEVTHWMPLPNNPTVK